MRQLWFSVGLLLAVIGALALNARTITGFVLPLAEELTASVENAEKGEWTEAAGRTESASRQWRSRVPYLHLVRCHNEVDEVTALFHDAEAQLSCRDLCGYTVSVNRIAEELRSISAWERLSWGNLF